MHSFVFIILFCPEAARVKLKNCSRDFILPLFFSFLFFFFLPSKQFRDRDAETAPAHKTRWNSTQMTQFPNVTNLKRQHFTVGFVNYSSLETENNAEQRAFCAKSVSRPEVKLHRKKRRLCECRDEDMLHQQTGHKAMRACKGFNRFVPNGDWDYVWESLPAI